MSILVAAPAPPPEPPDDKKVFLIIDEFWLEQVPEPENFQKKIH